MADGTVLNEGSGGDTILTEQPGGTGPKIPVSKIRLGAQDVDGGDVTPTNPFPVAIEVSGAPVDPRAIRALTSSDEVTVTGSISVSASALPTGAAQDATLTARLGTLGQKTSADSAPVVIASDQSAIPITGSITADNASVGTTGATAPTSATEIGGLDGSGNLRSPVVKNVDPATTDYGIVVRPVNQTAADLLAQVSGSVSVSNFPSTQPVSGSVSVGNFPSTQPVSGSVSVSNFPSTYAITYPAKSLASILATASLVFKASAGNLMSLRIRNRSASPVYAMVFNSTTVPADGSVTPYLPPFLIPASSDVNFGTDYFTEAGIPFSTGISVAVSTTDGSTKTLATTAANHDISGAYL